MKASAPPRFLRAFLPQAWHALPSEATSLHPAMAGTIKEGCRKRRSSCPMASDRSLGQETYRPKASYPSRGHPPFLIPSLVPSPETNYVAYN
ncbi:hypothetical protein AOLI_G00094410 [Acnodon oligacanthus]